MEALTCGLMSLGNQPFFSWNHVKLLIIKLLVIFATQALSKSHSRFKANCVSSFQAQTEALTSAVQKSGTLNHLASHRVSQSAMPIKFARVLGMGTKSL